MSAQLIPSKGPSSLFQNPVLLKLSGFPLELEAPNSVYVILQKNGVDPQSRFDNWTVKVSVVNCMLVKGARSNHSS
jgi:hypothetical protein